MKRQITESEKAQLLVKYRQPDSFIHCFVDNEIIENEKDIHFDHIDPFSKVEKTYLENIAPVCKNHNLAKKDMSLSEYRDKLNMEKFFKQFDSINSQVKLNDILKYKYGDNFGFPINVVQDQNSKKITLKYFMDLDKVGPPHEETYPIFQCPITKMNYFYATICESSIILF